MSSVCCCGNQAGGNTKQCGCLIDEPFSIQFMKSAKLWLTVCHNTLNVDYATEFKLCAASGFNFFHVSKNPVLANRGYKEAAWKENSMKWITFMLFEWMLSLGKSWLLDRN